jgi:WbqC-like protein family
MSRGDRQSVEQAGQPVATPFTVAVMQPYFIPYAGYFRLFAASDLFVIYDCVQFARRGWVHRNRLLDASGVERWLTLPLAKAPQNVLIRDLRFAPDASTVLAQRLNPFPSLASKRDSVRPIVEALRNVQGHPVDYLEHLLKCVVDHLGIPWNVIRSSTLNLPSSLRGQDRILEIARRLGARRYVNAPGGRDLYDPASFADAGIDLCFLPEYQGPSVSILERMIDEDHDQLANDIRAIPAELRAIHAESIAG